MAADKFTVGLVQMSCSPEPDENLERAVEHIREAAAHTGPDQVTHCVEANVRANVNHLRYGSRILEEHMLSGKVAIVGAVYAVETGVVSLLE